MHGCFPKSISLAKHHIEVSCYVVKRIPLFPIPMFVLLQAVRLSPDRSIMSSSDTIVVLSELTKKQ